MILYVPQPTPTIATQISIFTDYHPPDLRCSACRFCQLDRLVSFDRRPVSRTSSQEANTLGNPRASSVVGTGAWVLPEMFLANSGKWGPIMSNPSQNQCCSEKEIITRKHAGAEKDHQSPAVPGCNSHPPQKIASGWRKILWQKGTTQPEHVFQPATNWDQVSYVSWAKMQHIGAWPLKEMAINDTLRSWVRRKAPRFRRLSLSPQSPKKHPQRWW